MEIAVTGGSGRLGRELIKLLTVRGDTIRNLDRTPPKPAPADGERVIEIDLADLVPVTEAMRGVDAIAHLAAIPGPQLDNPPGIVYRNNTIASYDVLRRR